jgi:hypothetical protein
MVKGRAEGKFGLNAKALADFEPQRHGGHREASSDA